MDQRRTTGPDQSDVDDVIAWLTGLVGPVGSDLSPRIVRVPVKSAGLFGNEMRTGIERQRGELDDASGREDEPTGPTGPAQLDADDRAQVLVHQLDALETRRHQAIRGAEGRSPGNCRRGGVRDVPIGREGPPVRSITNFEGDGRAGW